MMMTDTTRDRMNRLITNCFLLNMKLDNLVYQIDYFTYVNIAKIVHRDFAHKPPEWADFLSDTMIMLDEKPVRYDLQCEYVDCEGDLISVFNAIIDAMTDFRVDILSTLDIAELNNDIEVKLKLEELLLIFTPYYKQARTWLMYASRYVNDYKSFDVHFEDFTTFIPME